MCVLLRHDFRPTHHTRLGDAEGDENQEDAEDGSDLDGEAAWLALQPKTTASSGEISFGAGLGRMETQLE